MPSGETWKQGVRMTVVRWFVIVGSLGLATVVAVGSERNDARSSGISPVAMSTNPALPLVEGMRLCQSYRLKDGVASKVGRPHPCHEKKHIQQLSENLHGGATLPQ